MPAVISRHLGEMEFETEVGKYKILSDVPPTPEWGGKGRHPTPPDYFVASLASCIAAFVVHYGAQSDIDTSGLTVEVSYEKGTQPSHLKDIAVTISLPAVELGERVEAIKRVAHHCTVHETIEKMGAMSVQVRDCGGLPV